MSVGDPSGRVEIGEPSAPSALKDVNILRSTFHRDNNGRLTQGEDGNTAYFGGGHRNIKNVCYFSTPVFENDPNYPKQIKLYLTPNNVVWDYTLKTNVIDTYGGQVIQVLGVSIENMTIQGFFGEEGMWGIETNDDGTFKVDGGSRFDTSDVYKWQEGPFMNGLFQFSQWFKEYFYRITQLGNFSTAFMQFDYPHMGWKWLIRPLELPRVRFANNELAPQWQLNCDFIEDLQRTFTGTVNETAKTALSKLKDGVGFMEFISWSEPVYSSATDMSTMIKDTGQKYSKFMETELTDKQIKTLITQGYSYPSQVNNNIETTNYEKYLKDKKVPINPSRLATLLDEQTGAGNG